MAWSLPYGPVGWGNTPKEALQSMYAEIHAEAVEF